MIRAKWVFILSLALAVLLGVALHRLGSPSPSATKVSEPLIVYCAAGMKAPVEVVAHEYEKTYGVPIHLQYDGSGSLLSKIKIARRGDLFLAADESYLWMGRTNHLVQEMIPLATMMPVLAVPKGNPKKLKTVADLLRPEVAVSLANPEAAAIGMITRKLLQHSGHWNALQPRVKVFKPTVNDIANDIKLGTVDAGILWDAVARQYPELEAIVLPELASGRQRVTIGVLQHTQQPIPALRFARYLSSRDRGLPVFSRFGYETMAGDAWAEKPDVILFSGGVNRIAIEDTLRRFEQREGVSVNRVYNGCGILVSQIKAGQKPDAYFACDTSFMTSVADLFLDSTDLSQTAMVIITSAGNPRGVRDLKGLARPGLRVGVANPQQSALGALTQKLLAEAGLESEVMANVKVQTPTADLLVNQMRAGALDAAIVYAANTSQVREHLAVIPVEHPGAKAIQPYAVARQSNNQQLMRRLLEMLQSGASRRQFEAAGFDWVHSPANP